MSVLSELKEKLEEVLASGLEKTHTFVFGLEADAQRLLNLLDVHRDQAEVEKALHEANEVEDAAARAAAGLAPVEAEVEAVEKKSK